MSRRKRGRYCPALGSGGVPAALGSVSVAISLIAGGDVKSLLLMVHLVPPWQLAQPARTNRERPWATSVGWGPPPVPPPPASSSSVVSAPLGVRMAKRTHSFRASSAGQAVSLPGSVT